jgi:hypothetical protein
MTLSKYTDNLYQSEVYRELERQAVKKGFFKPTDNEIVRLAAQEINMIEKINQPMDSSPSEDLVQDVVRLAFAMRRKGFIAQAEDIEQKLVIYKQAESACYNVTQETNADLIGFAHRDGDVNIIEGSGELGTFETMQSISDKILAVTRKQPTGQQPMNRMASLAAMINKIAAGVSYSWEDETPKTRKETVANIDSVLQEFDVIRNEAPSLDGFYFSNLNNPAQQAAYIYFARLAGIQINPQTIVAWYRMVDVARREGVLIEGNVPVVSAEALYTKLNNAIPAWMRLHPATALIPAQTKTLRNIANAIGVLDTFDSTYLNENNPSTYIFAGGLQVATNDAKSMAACQWLAQQVKNVYIAAFGENNNNIVVAQAAMRSVPEKLYTDLKGIKIGAVVNIDMALKQLSRVNKEITDALATFSKEPVLGQLKTINAQLAEQILSWVAKMSALISGQYKSILTSDQKQPLKMDISQLNAAYEAWVQRKDNKSQAIAEKIQTLIGIIEKYNDKPWMEMQDALKESSLGISEPTRESLKKSIQVIIDSARRA